MGEDHSDPIAEPTEKLPKMGGKKMINDVDNIVDEALDALVKTNPGVNIIENHRVIVRSDVENLKDKVAILCGGGSGHEPAFAGYVGKGCLSAAVAGSVFASPPPKSILAGLLTLASLNPSGILVMVINYTGDRVNFGLAVERARSLTNVRFETFTVADDTALTSADKTAGKRGLSGAQMVLKIAGAMAEQGKSIDEILDMLSTKVAPHLGTIGLSLGPCIVPGRPRPSFTLGEDQMELGLGVHGEAGVKRIKVESAKESVRIMLSHMTNPKSATHLALKNGDYVSVLLNNLGAMSNLEMGVLANEVVSQLEENHKLSVRRFYSGSFFTSLDMPGFSVSVLKLTSSDLVGYLEAETTCGGWSGCAYPRRLEGKRTKLPDPILNLKSKTSEGPETDKFGREALSKAVTFACEALISCEDQLNTMDSGSGDSDCESTLKRGAEAILGAVKKSPDVTSRPSALFHLISTVAETDMGGSSGAMYSLLFESAAVLIEGSSEVNATIAGKAFKAGLDAVMKYGRAQPGDRTMVDALSPAVASFTSTLSSSGSALKALEEATCAAEEGAKATLNMKASAGRASYVAASELRHPDPGAHAIGIIMRAVFEGYKIKANEMGL